MHYFLQPSVIKCLITDGVSWVSWLCFIATQLCCLVNTLFTLLINGALIRKYLSVFEDFYRKNAQINDFGNVISENYVWNKR